MKRLTTMAQAFAQAGFKFNQNYHRYNVSVESNYALSYKTAMKLKTDGIID